MFQEKKSDNAKAYLKCGMCYMDLEMYDKAVSSFREATSRDPQISGGQFRLIEALFHSGQREEAIQGLQQLY